VSSPDYDELERDFGEVVGMLREGRPELLTERPGEGVWAAIAAEVGAPHDNRGPAPTDLAAHRDPDDEAGPGQATDPATTAASDAGGDVDRPRSITSAPSWRRRAALLTLAAAAALLVGVPLALSLGGDGGPSRRAQLAALGGFAGTGQAELDDHTLSVELEGAAPQQGAFYELWLLDLDGGEVRDLRSLGRVDAGGSFEVPDDVDLDRFDVVDVSLEPDDGNPDHSGDSVLRGDLIDA
jgi:hypothetical protein